MVILYLARHGETLWNTQQIMQGWSNSELTESGIRHAISLGNRLKDVPFQAVYASPSKRAVHTAELIMQNRNTPSIIVNDNLRELKLGEWEGKTQSYVEEHYPTEYHDFWYAPARFTVVGGESFTDFQKRVFLFLKQMEQQEGNVLVVTHTVVIKYLLAYFKDIPLEKLWDPPYIHDTSLTVIERNGEMNQVMLEGDHSHR
ncbi:histidine phosphatase family protein [Ectobacillus polymachus]|uniref:histidine phosphatase family protein n=1 Tax=Ectobacillus polymachus TaxID=1508806 RepID=UPI003A878184